MVDWYLLFRMLCCKSKPPRPTIVLHGFAIVNLGFYLSLLAHTARASNLRQDLITAKVSCVITKQSDRSIMIRQLEEQNISINNFTTYILWPDTNFIRDLHPESITSVSMRLSSLQYYRCKTERSHVTLELIHPPRKA